MDEILPPSQDQGSHSQFAPAERHKQSARQTVGKDRNFLSDRSFPHREAETAIQFISRWAGPAALIATLAFLAWAFIN